MSCDIDTGGQCTGDCCQNFSLVFDGRPASWGLVARLQQDPSWQVEAEEGNDLARFAVPATAPGRFNCTKFDPITKRCTIYEQRPPQCRVFPQGNLHNGVVKNECHHCHFRVGEPTNAES